MNQFCCAAKHRFTVNRDKPRDWKKYLHADCPITLNALHSRDMAHKDIDHTEDDASLRHNQER